MFTSALTDEVIEGLLSAANRQEDAEQAGLIVVNLYGWGVLVVPVYW